MYNYFNSKLNALIKTANQNIAAISNEAIKSFKCARQWYLSN